MSTQTVTAARAAVLTTDPHGQVTWTFSIPFQEKTEPVIHVQVMSPGGPYFAEPISLNHLKVVLQIKKAAVVNIGVHEILGPSTNVGANLKVHVVAFKQS